MTTPDSAPSVNRYPPSTVNAVTLDKMGISQRFAPARELSHAYTGFLWNIDGDSVLRTDFTPDVLRSLMEQLDEPVVIKQTASTLQKRALLIEDNVLVIIPQKLRKMPPALPGIYYAVGRGKKSPTGLDQMERDVGGGFYVRPLDTYLLQAAMKRYMDEKRPSRIAKAFKSVGFGRRKDAATTEEPIGPNDTVGFTREDLTPALLCHAMELYAKHVPEANIKLIAQLSDIRSLQIDIRGAFDRDGGIAPRYGSEWTKESKFLLRSAGKTTNGESIYTFEFHPNMDDPRDDEGDDIQIVVKEFSRAIGQLLRDWHIAHKVQKNTGN